MQTEMGKIQRNCESQRRRESVVCLFIQSKPLGTIGTSVRCWPSIFFIHIFGKPLFVFVKKMSILYYPLVFIWEDRLSQQVRELQLKLILIVITSLSSGGWKSKRNLPFSVRALFLACNGCPFTVSSHAGERGPASFFLHWGLRL